MSTDSKEEEINYIDSNTPPYPYVISIPKLIVLNLFTFGFYEIYWFYKQWKSLKYENKLKVTPLGRAIFAPIFAYYLFKEVSNNAKRLEKDKGIEAGALAFLYFFLTRVFLGFLPLIVVQNRINYYWQSKYGNRLGKSKFGLWNWIVIGISLLVLYSSNYNSTKSNSLTTNSNSDQTTSWVSFTEQSGQFSVLFPTYPKHEKQYLPVENSNLQLPYDSYLSEVNNRLAYIIGVATYPQSIDISIPQNNLDSALAGTVNSNKSNILISSANSRFNGYPAKDFMISQNSVTLKGKFILAGNTMYEIIVSYYETDGQPSTYERFINSLQIH